MPKLERILTARRCIGITREIRRCRRVAIPQRRYCKQHSRQPAYFISSAILALVLGVAGNGIYDTARALLQGRHGISAEELASRSARVKQRFHRGLGDPTELTSEIDVLMKARDDPELQLIKIMLLSYSGRREAAEQELNSLRGISDASQLRIIRKIYGLFVATYDVSTEASVFSAETFYSIDGKAFFLGPTISSQQYKEWFRVFTDVSLILPLFNSNSNSTRAPRLFYDTLIDRQPNLAWARTMRAIDSYYHGDYQAAINEASHALELDGEQPRAYRIRAIAFEESGDSIKALDDYSTSLRLQNRDARTYIDRATLYFKLKRYGEVIADCDQAIRLNPNATHAYRYRGLSLLEMDKYDEALRDFSFIVDNSKESELRFESLANSIMAYVYRGDFTMARARMDDEDFKKLVLENEPKSTEIVARLKAMVHDGVRKR